MVESKKKLILLAEDDVSMRRFVEIVLKQAGFEVSPAEDGLAAMQIAMETKVDAVVADAIMPNLSGFDLCRIINENAAETRIPCIILSGLEQPQTEQVQKIADVFLTKNDKLREKLIAALNSLI